MILKDKRALITGGSRGLGAAIVQRFAVEGAKTAFTYARDEDGATATAGTIRESGGDVRAFKVSVIDGVATGAMVDELEKAWGGIDILVSNEIGRAHV